MRGWCVLQRLAWRSHRNAFFSQTARRPCPVCHLLALFLTVWQIDRISNADAYTLEQVRHADYNTNCGLGFAGLHCNEVITCEVLDYCSGHGLCQRGGHCICDPGWEGPACEHPNCPSKCSGHGSCAATGGCVCDAGFTGIICNQVICLGGGNCTGHGSCLAGGICECEKGYLGAACDVIDVAQKCSNHGFPDENGDCKCDLWYTGPDCSLALCLNNCSDHGACDSRSGSCWCDPGWTAADCSKLLCQNNCTGHGVCFEGQCSCQDGYDGVDCSIIPCINSCSGNGACFNGTCACDILWTGEDCSLYAGYLQDCPGNCTGRGTCMNSTCHCDPGWSGLDCLAPVDCPGNCTGHGVCYNATCSCDLGFSSLDCSISHCLNNCSMHGSCTLNGTCACDPFFHGADCSLADLNCGMGFHGNCSGHGTCMDSAINQWWSGSSSLPDMWAWEASSRHLVRRDVASLGETILGACIEDFYGIPSVVENQASMKFAEDERILMSNGVPEHFTIHNGFPLCEVTWSISIPLQPNRATGPCDYGWPLPRDALCVKPKPLPRDSPIAFALNGLPIWGALLSDGSNAVEGPEAVPCYGHSSRTGMWHYHHPLVGCNVAANQETLLGYALDGYQIYGPLPGTKDDVDAILDKCNGRALEDGTYRYHVRTLAQVDEMASYQDESIDPRNPNGAQSHNNWNYVLGCFSGNPTTSMGLRQVLAPLTTKSDKWISHQETSALSTSTLADQLGLTSRIGICVCDSGWTGSDCQKMGCLNNCSSNGFCDSNDTSSHCRCDSMWEGEDCSRRTNTTCNIGCSGHGTCLWENYPNASCLCDPAWHGSNCQDPLGPLCPYNCSGHGSCLNRTCVCDHMYDGSGCESPSAAALNLNLTSCWQWIGNILTNNSCSGQGSCFNGTCLCDAGWVGMNCSTPFVPDPVFVECFNNCSFHGACSFLFDPMYVTYNGTCLCDAGFAGPDCSIDWGAHQCNGNCSAHGTCVNETCICDSGWVGVDCNEKWVSPYRLCPMNCSHHGTCFNGSCTCDRGWNGLNCSIPDSCPQDCSGHGACLLGNCTCDPDWAGDDCSRTSFCPGFVPEIGINCSGHGTCLDGYCSCTKSWRGADCSIEGCINSCSNNGFCRNGTCDCFVGFVGDDCSLGPYSGECPSDCSGHGACAVVEGSGLPAGISDIHGDGMLSGRIGCVCDDAWEGPDCSIRSCPNECSGNGACAQNGTCYCYHNWAGLDCSTAWCPNECNNHGICVGGEGCLCDLGYDGEDCGISSCPGNCTGRGVCMQNPGLYYTDNMYENDAEKGYETIVNNSFSSCLCFYGWGGDDCSEISCPLNCSFPNGFCSNGTCICDTIGGYFGRNCSEQYGRVELRNDGNALTPSFGIFDGGSIVTVRGTGFVSSNTMRCKFGSKIAVAHLVQPNPPEFPYATCLSPGEKTPSDVLFQFSLDDRLWTEPDARIQFVYHGNGIVTGMRWPTSPEQGGTSVTFFGINFQYALGVKCKFGTFEILGSFNIRFIEDPVTKEQELEAQLLCPVPPLKDLQLPAGDGNTVELWVSMDMGQNWLRYESDYYFSYYGLSHISPSFGPQQDQNTVIAMYGFNFYQGAGRQDLFPGFQYQYSCVFRAPWTENPIEVRSPSISWNLSTAPFDGSVFECKVPPGLVGESHYSGPVEVGISLNPCILDPASTSEELGCLDSLPYTTEPIIFYYIENTVNALSTTLGPVTGGTIVTIEGNGFDKRDLTDLPDSFQHLPILCKWGTEINVGKYNEVEKSVTCVSPPCTSASCTTVQLSSCPNCVVPVRLEVALNGLDFSDSRVEFFYFKDPQVQKIHPTLGSILGGTTVTVESSGFHDPCLDCLDRNDCNSCGSLVVCQFLAQNRVQYTTGSCIRNSQGLCEPALILCPVPNGRSLRANVVSLDPFYVAVSVSVNNQTFYPYNIGEKRSYNVYDEPCLDSRTAECAFLFKFYEVPVLSSVLPSAIPGDGGGRVTVRGINFLNENGLRCRFGAVLGPRACESGATGDFSAISNPDLCISAYMNSPIFISSDVVICGTVSLSSLNPAGGKIAYTSIGLTFNGGDGAFDTYWLLDESLNIRASALQVYWVLGVHPTLGFATGGTRVTVTGVNLEAAASTEGDNTNMRCRFGDAVVFPDPQQVPDPVDFVRGTIHCTSPAHSKITNSREEVVFGICLIGVDCEYVGKEKQASPLDTHVPTVNHFTKSVMYLYYKAPELSSLTPSLGPRDGKTIVTIRGVGFFASPVLSCRFDLRHSSTASTFVDASTIICETPAMQSDQYNVEITLNDQQYSAGCPGIDVTTGKSGYCWYYFYVEPMITAVTPQVGINTGSTPVVLTVENAITAFHDLKCRFRAVYAPDVERLAIEGLDMVTAAQASGSTVKCFSPDTTSASGEPILHTATTEQPSRGLTYVSVTWNGQQFGPFDESSKHQAFRYHDQIQAISLVPSGGPTSASQVVTLFGENFVNTSRLTVQMGEDTFLCSPAADISECPNDDTHLRDVISFISSQALRFVVPTSELTGRKTVKVSNNAQPSEFSRTEVKYQYYSASDRCPNQCRGVASAPASHGTCDDVTDTCKCNEGYSGLDCSIGPTILTIKPSSGLVTGGWHVTVTGRNFWTQNISPTSNNFKEVLLDSRIQVDALSVVDDQLVFMVPTTDMRVAPDGMAVEITINGVDYTVDNRKVQLFNPPSISGLMPDGAHYSGNVVVTVTGTNFVDSDFVRVRLGPDDKATECHADNQLCMRAVYVSSTRIVFTSKPCLDSCNFQAPQLVQIALNGVNFINTQQYFRFLRGTEIVSIEPRVGSMYGETSVLFTATNMNLTTGFTCKFGDLVVTGSLLQDSGKLLCKSPAAMKNHTVPVTIALDGQIYSETPDCDTDSAKCYKFTSSLQISGVYPSLGPAEGGTKIIISGSGFYSVIGVQGLCRFSSTTPNVPTITSPMSYIDSGHFSCLSPPFLNAPIEEEYDFRIAANGVDFEQYPFRYQTYKHPVVMAGSDEAVKPIGSAIEGGTSVTISGTGFIDSKDGIRVRWTDVRTDPETGQTSVASIFVSGKAKFVSNQQIVVTTTKYPHGPSLTRLSVSLNDGLDYSSPAAQTFSFFRVPTLTEVQPPLGPRLGETSVVLIGSGFIKLRSVAKCRFGDFQVPAVFDDSDVIGGAVFRCKSPPWSKPDWVNVEVAMDGQVFTSSKTVKFQYYGEFDVSSVVPAGGPKAGGTEVTVTGVGLFMSGVYLSCFYGEGDFECKNGRTYPCYKAVSAIYRTTTSVTCVSPEMPAGGSLLEAYPVRVGLNGQYSQSCPNVNSAYQCPLKSALAFTYYSDVFIRGISPNSGQAQGGTEVTVYGLGFRKDLETRTRCMFTRCTDADIYMSGENYGKFRDPTAPPKCSGETVYSPLNVPGAVGVISDSVIRCLAPLASTANSHFTLFDISLNKGVTNQNLYGPLCQNGCPVLYFYYALPQLAYNLPSLGAIVGGTVVTINGVGFIGTQNTPIRCKFGSVESTAQSTGIQDPVKFLTDSSISCVAPAQDEATVRVSVSLNGIQSDFTQTELGAPYRYYKPPVLTGVPMPTLSPTSGGAVVTLSGTGFLNGNLQCKFWTGPSKGNSQAIVRADYVSGSKAVCTTPAFAGPQLVSISLSLNGQDFSPFFYDNLFYYFPSPDIYQLIPRGGSAASGGFTMVRGKGFLNNDKILCRVGVVITRGSYVNDTFVKCTVPQIQRKIYSQVVQNLGIQPEILSGTFAVYPVQAYPLEVSIDGQTFTSSSVQYTYYTTPQIDQIVPSSGSKSSLTTVAIINGANFRNDFGGPFCRFAGVGATKAVFMNDRSIRCQIPAIPLGKTVLVELSINGQEYEDHASALFSFMGAAPVLKTATLSPAFDVIRLNFDVNTDRGRQSGTFHCGKILKWRSQDLGLPSSGLSIKQAQALGNQASDQAVFQALFGYGVKCSWETNKTAMMVLGAYPNFQIGHPIWLKDDLFQRGNELTYYASGNAIILSTHAAKKPVAMLASPSQIGRCDHLNIDAKSSTGGLGRSLYFSWILDLGKSSILNDNLPPSQKMDIMSNLSSLISSFSGIGSDPSGEKCRNPSCFVPATNSTASRYENCLCHEITWPFANYPQGQYTVQLQVSNWQKAISENTSMTITKHGSAIPTVSIDMFASDAGRLVQVNRSLSLSGSGVGSLCESSPPTLLFKWAIYMVQGGLETAVALPASVQLTSRSINLPAYSLRAGRTYKIRLRVTQKDKTCILPELCQAPTYLPHQCCAVGSDTVVVQAGTSIPVAIIEGGERTVSAGTLLQLSGSASFHPDYPGQMQQEAKLQYKWTCKDTPTLGTTSTGGCFSEGLLKSFGFGQEMSLRIPSDSMRTTATDAFGQKVDMIYDFTLNVSDADSWSVATVRVRPTSEAVPLVTVLVKDSQRVYSPNKRLSLLSSVAPATESSLDSLLFQWTTLSGDTDVTKTQFLLSPTSRERSLIIKPNVFTAGQQYTVRLSVTENGKIGYAQATFTIDNPPSGGAFEVYPTSGTSLETMFSFRAVNWQVDEGTLPMSYAFEFLQRGNTNARLIQGASEVSAIRRMLPPGLESQDHLLALQLHISNAIGSETVATTCNMLAGDCLVTVQPKEFASSDAMISDLSDRTSEIENLLNTGDTSAAINFVSLLLGTINSAGGRARRRTLLSQHNATAIASFKCGTIAPLLYKAMPSSGLSGVSDAHSIARSTAAGTMSLFSVPSEVNNECLVQMDKIYKVVLEYAARGSSKSWASTPDMALLQDIVDSISLATTAAQLHYSSAVISKTDFSKRIAKLLTQYENSTAILTFGSTTTEAAKVIDSSITRTKAWRIRTPTAAASARRGLQHPKRSVNEPLSQVIRTSGSVDQVEGRTVYAGGRRLLVMTYAGSTSLPALSGSFTQSLFSMPANKLPFQINNVGCSTGSSGSQVCEEASVSVVATQYVSDPHYYADDAQFVIAPVLSLQLQAFGLQEVLPVTDLANDIIFDLQLKQVPDSTKNATTGSHRVAACVWWNGTKWDTSGCRLSKVAQASDGGNEMRAICFCNHTSLHSVLDAPAGCDSIPYSTTVYDKCLKCGGDGSTCVGCDGKVASGKVIDGCGKCGGDNSICAGCDGIPNSGLVIDECNVCGGDNSSCRGCDGIAIHPYVTVRFPEKKPKTYDNCKSPANPLGVCGGCDASCQGCNGKANSGKTYDKCGKCGEFASSADAATNGVGPADWYSRTSKDNCALGLKKCEAGYVPDSCGTCVPLSASSDVRNLACKGCDDVAAVFSYQNGTRQLGGLKIDRCGICGGNDCSCVDCRGVVGGKARDDRCGVCEGNNACLDCKGVPYGTSVIDVCGICGGKNDTEQCRGCDDKLYPLPLKPPRLDRYGTSLLSVCCPADKIGCNDICNAVVGCDGKCSTTPLILDKCGVCGGSGAPNTGDRGIKCDCNGIPNGNASVGCDKKCSSPPAKIDICGVCGGKGERETGHCDCENMPYGSAVRDSSGVCCYFSDMGCAQKNQSRCFSGKTWDACNTCGGDGGTCSQIRASSASRRGTSAQINALLSAHLGLLLLCAIFGRLCIMRLD